MRGEEEGRGEGKRDQEVDDKDNEIERRESDREVLGREEKRIVTIESGERVFFKATIQSHNCF